MRVRRARRQPIGPTYITFGRTIRELRVRRGLSQEQLGLHGGLHRNYVASIERGEINPTLRTMLRLQRGLDFPLSEIVLLFDQRRDEGDRP
ncbi:helix-turn-helix transcriptional regulator [Conexibacter woesei]|uniref:Transcriptional regulator, XRE family n=1 Tax=Conexibacter woesei (strain DSM 14684 / CCUG 47730 / CIP 108061 / JCM 11494 / NBRC 100937 / ID131577) TaxID=469383 RepID=D3F9G3_CONWI|nr:helix-turn-helix transcriptional regulator [Conexibacter woesei]ADB49130.1 transcriptional regulator, XRE family [Conexibacter woesei DSM 14684]